MGRAISGGDSRGEQIALNSMRRTLTTEAPARRAGVRSGVRRRWRCDGAVRMPCSGGTAAAVRWHGGIGGARAHRTSHGEPANTRSSRDRDGDFLRPEALMMRKNRRA